MTIKITETDGKVCMECEDYEGDAPSMKDMIWLLEAAKHIVFSDADAQQALDDYGVETDDDE